MKKLFSMAAALVLMLSALIIPQPQAVAAAPDAHPVMTYIRFNRYGGDIYTTYCIASATSYNLHWGAAYPVSWSTWASYGAINNCTTKYLFSQVVSGEILEVSFEIFGGGSPINYEFQVHPEGNTNIGCYVIEPYHVLKVDPRLNSQSACAFIE